RAGPRIVCATARGSARVEMSTGSVICMCEPCNTNGPRSDSSCPALASRKQFAGGAPKLQHARALGYQKLEELQILAVKERVAPAPVRTLARAGIGAAADVLLARRHRQGRFTDRRTIVRHRARVSQLSSGRSQVTPRTLHAG